MSCRHAMLCTANNFTPPTRVSSGREPLTMTSHSTSWKWCTYVHACNRRGRTHCRARNRASAPAGRANAQRTLVNWSHFYYIDEGCRKISVRNCNAQKRSYFISTLCHLPVHTNTHARAAATSTNYSTVRERAGFSCTQSRTPFLRPDM